MSETTADRLAVELDKQVAEVLGYSVDSNPLSCFILVSQGESGIGVVEFNPSNDWNHAQRAAELFELFDGRGKNCSLTRDKDWEGNDVWVVVRSTIPNYDEPFGKDESGPTAICKAIIKLSQSDGQ